MKYFSSPEDRDQAFKLIGQGWLPGSNAGTVVRTHDGRAGWADPTVWLAMTEIMAREAARPQPQETRPALQTRALPDGSSEAASCRSTGTAGSAC